jgi:hypothetical protein
MFETPLTLDGLGNIYGSTYEGGGAAGSAGIVFELIPQTSGAWTEKILYTFQGGADGAKPLCGVIVDKSEQCLRNHITGRDQRWFRHCFRVDCS